MKSGDKKVWTKRDLLLVLSVFVLIGILGLMSSTYTGGSIGGAKTIIAGEIYYEGPANPVGGAEVLISCNHNGIVTRKKAESAGDGTYSNYFMDQECDDGDFVVVEAEKNGLEGSNTGVVENSELQTLDIAIVNVPLVPEFGVIVGGLTILGALGIFFLVRRK